MRDDVHVALGGGQVQVLEHDLVQALGLGLPEPLAVGLVLIAACPAAAPAGFFTHLARGDTMLCVCLTAATTLTSVVTVPLFVNGALHLLSFGRAAGAPAHAR